jgi:hypothetical protein
MLFVACHEIEIDVGCQPEQFISLPSLFTAHAI